MAKVPLTDIELSYLDLISMLREDVEKDIIPRPDKRDSLRLITQLSDLLEPYSG